MSNVREFPAAGQLRGIDCDDPNQCWRLHGGSLDIFAVPVNAAGESVTTGRYLFTLEPREIVCGIAPCPLGDDIRLAIRAIAVPGETEAVLVPLSLDAVFLEGTSHTLDGWLLHLAASLRSGEEPEMLAEPDYQHQHAPAGIRIGAPPDTVLWLEVEDGAFVKQIEEAPASMSTLLALPTGCCIQTLEPTIFSAWTTATVSGAISDRKQFELSLVRANAHLFALLAKDYSARRSRDADQITGRLRQNAFAFASGLRRAASVLRRDTFVPTPDISGDPLFAAASMVAASQKIELKRISRSEKTSSSEYLEAICRASRINLRQVRLPDDWYRQDNGPLLGFLKEAEGESRPVALLPHSSSEYVVIDPEQGDRHRVRAPEAQSVESWAWMFYRTFDATPVGTRTLIRFGLSGMRIDLIRLFSMGLLGGLLSLVLPLISDPLFNDILPRADIGSLITVVLALAAATLGASAFQLVRSFSLVRIEGRMEAGIQTAVWDRLLRLKPGFFRNYTTGDLADRVMNITTIRSVITSAISGSILDAVFSIISFAVMFWYSWRLALVAVALALIAVFLTVLLTSLQVPHQRAMMRSMGRIDGLTYQLLTAIGKLRIAGAEARVFGRWTTLLAQQKEHAYRARRIAALQHTVTQTFPPLTSVALYVAMIKLGEEIPRSDDTVPLLTLGAYLAFNAAFGQFISALMSVVSALTSLVTIVPLYERIQPVLESRLESGSVARTPLTLSGEIEFRNVTFRYQENAPPVIKDLSFHIHPGEYVALVGSSGTGKSTIVRLILGFERAQSGGIFFDQKDITNLDPDDLRRQMGIVLQSAGLLIGTLYDNIAASQPISMEEAWEAARLAGLGEDIRAMPLGMHTHVSDSATTLSGGQRQRLVIARALVRKPRMLLFDEATSALDNHTQTLLSETLAGLNLTRIVIAHRLSTVRRANRILVLREGRIVESGSYDDLLSSEGPFSDLVKPQLL